MKKKLSLILTSLLCFSLIGCGNKANNATNNQPVELTISAAASLKEAMGDIEPLFTEKYPDVKLTFNFGASGSLQQQIEQGAPADVFISAGQKQMNALKDESLMVDDTCRDLVKNRLVLVGPSNTEITSLNDLTTDKVNKIAVGEPSSVPAGKYADEVLKNSNIYDSISSKLVFAKDVKEVLAWSTSGNADAGFVYLSDAMSNNSAKIIETISEDLHTPITYPVGVVKSTSHLEESKNFVDFLYSGQSKEIFEKYGYSPVE
ncbi:MAG: molybdate ABC transporter substrate-binding protein [Clostridium sp.]